MPAGRDAVSALPQELLELQQLARDCGSHVEHRVVGLSSDGQSIETFSMGNASRDVPAVGFFGGVHGLERIGIRVLVTYLRSLLRRIEWDVTLRAQLENVRLVFMPVVNPGGLVLGTRANPKGVDLMRNAPVEASGGAPWLIGGQRISAALPWYRGVESQPMEAESAALCAVVESELLSRSFSIALDCHSGFGAVDRIWFPYAHTRRPVQHLAEIHALATIFEESSVHHRYVIEPQSEQYLAHGDLWDHLYVQGLGRPDGIFLPLTLEMGSWIWVKKNPRQIFSRQGIFNPLVEHREHRVLRRHVAWFDFLTRAAASHRQWLPRDDRRVAEDAAARKRWYSPRVRT